MSVLKDSGISAGVDMLNEILVLFESNYPELLEVCYVVNGKYM